MSNSTLPDKIKALLSKHKCKENHDWLQFRAFGRATVDDLFYASKYGYTEIVRILLEDKIGGHLLVGDYGPSFELYPLTIASENGHTEIVSELLKAGADVHALCPYDKQPDIALRKAAAHGHVTTVRVLLEYKANVHARDHHSRGLPDAALRTAASGGHTEVVRTLIQHKANLHAYGRDGKPDIALREAAYRGQTEVVRLLLRHKADVHACGVDDIPDQALRWACLNNHLNTVELLLHSKANAQVFEEEALGSFVNHCFSLGATAIARGTQLQNLGLATRLRRPILQQIRNYDFKSLDQAFVSFDRILHSVCESLQVMILEYV